MEADQRRKQIWEQIQKVHHPVSASKLAEMFGVSRQVVVGDIALLRAQGCPILATARGYLRMPSGAPDRFTGKVASCHTPERTQEELALILSLGGEIVDVIVEHEVYGELVGQLHIASPEDLEVFIQNLKQHSASLLSVLTGGLHLHSIVCDDYAHFEKISAEVQKYFSYPQK